MKTIFSFLFVCCFFAFGIAQNTYTVNGENLQLTTEVDGELDLLWTIDEKVYRYFIRTKDGRITELKNTKKGRVYNEEYKETLYLAIAPYRLAVSIPTENTKLTTGSLKRLIDKFNRAVDSNYTAEDKTKKVNFRLSFLGGVTNHPLVENIENKSSFLLASELELYGNTDNPRHSGLLQLRQTFASDGDYSSTELSLGYRFRIVRKGNFNLFVQNRFAALSFASFDRPVTENGVTTIEDAGENNFDFPLAFGIGADLKVSDNSYITIIYDRFYAIGIENRDDFPTDIMIGYKLKL